VIWRECGGMCVGGRESIRSLKRIKLCKSRVYICIYPCCVRSFLPSFLPRTFSPHPLEAGAHSPHDLAVAHHQHTLVGRLSVAVVVVVCFGGIRYDVFV
jgi:hypothetical protein